MNDRTRRRWMGALATALVAGTVGAGVIATIVRAAPAGRDGEPRARAAGPDAAAPDRDEADEVDLPVPGVPSSPERLEALAFATRPVEELYDLKNDPDQFNNVADHAEYAGALKSHRMRVDEWMKRTHEARVDPPYDVWDDFPYYGKPTK